MLTRMRGRGSIRQSALLGWSRTSSFRVLGSEDESEAPPNDQLLRMALTGKVISGKASTVKTSSPLVSKLN